MTGKRGKRKEREEGKGFWFFFDVCGNVEKKFGFWILDFGLGLGRRDEDSRDFCNASRRKFIYTFCMEKARHLWGEE